MARTSQEIYQLIKRSPFLWPSAVIHTFVSGSAMHGATGNNPTDTDISGVYIQPVELILGIPQMRINEKGERQSFDPDTQVWSSSGDNNKNDSNDVDVNLFSLRKWANMAASGNTTALEFLFVPNMAEANAHIWNEHILPNREHFISKRAGFHFIEFAKSMIRRLKGEGTGKHGQRPELEAQFGYDTKAAMHALRVLGEGIELMQHGTITLPRREVPFLKDVRNGKFTWAELEKISDARLEVLADEQAKSFLPDEIDRAKISSIITRAQIEFWKLGITK